MTLERFQALAAAYGGHVARWPAEDREAALALSRNAACRAILRDAATLDAALDRWTEPPLDPALVGRFIASAPARADPVRGRLRLLWPAIGLATALAGASVGSLAVAALAPSDMPTAVGTVFGDIAGYGG